MSTDSLVCHNSLFALNSLNDHHNRPRKKTQNGLVTIMPVNYDYYFNNRVICSRHRAGGMCSLIDSGTTPTRPRGITCELANTPVAMLVGLLLVVSTLTARSLARWKRHHVVSARNLSRGVNNRRRGWTRGRTLNSLHVSFSFLLNAPNWFSIGAAL